MLTDNINVEDELTPKQVKGRNGSYLRVMKFRGRSFFPKMSEYRIQEQTVRDDDVYLVSYPKSGTHWLYNIISMLLKGQVIYRTEEMFLGFTNLKNIESKDSPRLIATHIPYSWLPKEVQENKNVKIINLFRNPKDTCVSYYHYVKKCNYFKGEWTDFFEMFTTKSKDICEGSWFTSFKSWEQARKEDPRILFIKYEDLRTDFKEQLLRLSNYLGVSYDLEFYDAIEIICKFENMRNGISRKPHDWWPNSVEDPIFRKGEIGDWKNYFTVAQNEVFDELYKTEMKESMEVFQYC